MMVAVARYGGTPKDLAAAGLTGAGSRHADQRWSETMSKTELLNIAAPAGEAAGDALVDAAAYLRREVSEGSCATPAHQELVATWMDELALDLADNPPPSDRELWWSQPKPGRRPRHHF
jgi:hypothetical protein